MKKGFTKILSLGCLGCLLMLLAGCCINIGSCSKAKYEREVHLSAPLPPGSTLAAQTHNGSITITGADVTDCNVIATIKARARSEEDAQKLAEEVKVKLEPFGDKLTVKIEKPERMRCMRNKSVSVNLDVKLPNQTDLKLKTHNGALRIANITGDVNGETHNGKVIATQVSGTIELRTHNGKVIAEQISGTIKLRTHNGSVTCKEISGDTQLRTHNGKIKAAYSPNATPVCNISMVTHNGGVDFTAPPNFSADIEASTHNGSIKTDIPITVIGKVSKRKLTGTIGAGQGKLHLETHNGSIKIR